MPPSPGPEAPVVTYPVPDDIHRSKGVRRHRAPHHITTVNCAHVPVMPIDDFRVAVIKNNVEGVERFLRHGEMSDEVNVLVLKDMS